jgi:dimethylargininase
MTIGTAYTRAISPRLATECELTHLQRDPIDLDQAIAQHAAYEAALAAAGLSIVRLEPLDDFADGTFVEDVAVILGDHAVILHPGVASRQGETASAAAGLAADLDVHRLPAGFVDGGDVLKIGRRLWVGLSTRSDRAGVEALAQVAGPLGYEVRAAQVTGCLHLKTAVTFAGADGAGTPTFLYNPDFVSPDLFEGAAPMPVVPGEAYAANILRVGDTLIAPADSPRTADALAERGFNVVRVDISQLRKAEAALTCMSLVATGD